MNNTENLAELDKKSLKKNCPKHISSKLISQSSKAYCKSLLDLPPSTSEQKNKEDFLNISPLKTFSSYSISPESLTTVSSKVSLISYVQCPYETALVNSRRRIPYSLGTSKPIEVFERQFKLNLSTKNEDIICGDILQLYETLLPSSENNNRWTKFLKKLTIILKKEWPNKKITVQAFGSTVNQLCTSESDVDVCITTVEKGLVDTCRLAKVLASYGMERVVCVPRAKVPIVKIWDPELSVACDMNINNTLALENTRMIKTYVEIDPRVRPLAMIIKYWAKKRILNDAAGGGTLSSYTWICMIINFLQMRKPPILPSLHQLPHEQNEDSIIGGIDVSFFDDIDALKSFGEKNTESLGGLLFAFFRRFAYEFDYDHCVISVRHGHYLSKLAKGWHLTQNNRLCVEEPFNTKRNLGNTADDITVKGLQIEFRRAFHLIANHYDLKEACSDYIFTCDENIYKINKHLRPLYCQISQHNRSNTSLYMKNDSYYKNSHNAWKFRYQQYSDYMNHFALNNYGFDLPYFSNQPDKSVYYDSKNNSFLYYISSVNPGGLIRYYPVIKENLILPPQDILHPYFPYWKKDSQDLYHSEGFDTQKRETSLNSTPYTISHKKEGSDSEDSNDFSPLISQFIPLTKENFSYGLTVAERNELTEFREGYISNTVSSYHNACKYPPENQIPRSSLETASLNKF
ncbi:hypothetical protein PMAC_001374 [Pneumocystis sp. 'macacae']|nr:hypothetical protein PMAC_001374 [Pneumocystis sp. 'macacae']